ncbi:MAG: FecR family protein [Xanthomonadales bacterium]|nr:FecR family protein [Xanthomonadales bacterium]
MKKDTSRQPGSDSGDTRADPIRELFRHADSRPEPSPEVRSEVRALVHREWQAATTRRRFRRRAAGFSIAASMALVVSVLVMNTPPRPAPAELVELARVERVSGHVRVVAPGGAGEGAALAQQTPVYAGQTLLTGDGSGIALRFEGGMSLRVDEHARLFLANSNEVRLESGRIYIDSQPGGVAREPGFAVMTRSGVVQHIGTQYMVRVQGNAVNVRVREGKVEFSPGAAGSSPLYVTVGEQLSVDESGGRTLAQADPSDDQWRWAEQLGPGFEMEGRSMREFLNWVSRETATAVVYLTPEAESVAAETQLHGTVDLPPRQALDLVIATSDLQAEFKNGAIHVRLKR